MYDELFFNKEKYPDPTMGFALARIQKEEDDKQAWLSIAKKMNDSGLLGKEK